MAIEKIRISLTHQECSRIYEALISSAIPSDAPLLKMLKKKLLEIDAGISTPAFKVSGAPRSTADRLLMEMGGSSPADPMEQILWTQYKAGSSLAQDDLITALDYGQSRKLLDDSEESKLSELIMARTFGA